MDRKEIDLCMQALHESIPAGHIQKLWALGKQLSSNDIISLAENKNEKKV